MWKSSQSKILLNRRGQVFFVTLMLFVTIIILGLALAPSLKIFSDTARNSTTSTNLGLDCSNTSISNNDKANCVATDLMMPYFIGFIIFMGGALLGAKILS